MRYNTLLRSSWWLLLAFLALFAFACTTPPAPSPAATTAPAAPAATPAAAAPTAAAPAATTAPAAKPAAPAATVAPAVATANAAATVSAAATQTAAAKELGATIAISKPANGTHFVAGEAPVLTITLRDPSGKTLDRAKDFGQLRLMASGPMSMVDTTTAVKLLKTTADRAVATHHYIDLKTNAEVQASGNVLTYKLGAVSDEKPGTYTASVWATSVAEPLKQVATTAEFQIGTATVEKLPVAPEKCASCHLGADSNKFYFAHTDPRAPGQPGNWSLDQAPVAMCKTCHNNEGYSAYVSPPGSTTRVPDPIVARVHGIHMGEHLKNPANTDPKTGIFRDYTEVIFPANVKNCTACHTDDRWQTKASQQACTTCHDNTWFGDPTKTPKDLKAHTAGPQADDRACASCHAANTSLKADVVKAHEVTQLVNAVDISLTPPGNGKFYVAGEKPKVTILVKDDTGKPITDHTRIDNTNFSTAGLFVYGNRAESVPVLTSTAKNGISRARASVSNGTAAAGDPTKGWTFAAGDTFKIAVNGNPPVELPAPAGLQTPAQVREWLSSNLSASGVTVNATATNVNIRSNVQGEKSRIEIYNSNVTKKMGWKPAGRKMANGQMTAGVTMEPYVVIGALSYPVNDLRKLSDPLDYSDPSVTRDVGNVTYQLDDIAGLRPGTYFVYVWVQPIAGRTPNVSRSTFGLKAFQVGIEKEELKVATNCTNCHGNNIWHLDAGPQHPEPFDTDYCKACHDYKRYATGDSFAALGGTSLSGWSGYGAVPIARRVHGVHFGRYLEHSEQIYAGNPDAFREAIFPQDVRNCTKCHDPKTTTAAWKQEPSRLACMACHDSDKANAHAVIMTQNPNPADPWSDARVESCTVCHGAGKDLAADKVHNISNPYKPPYPREPAE